LPVSGGVEVPPADGGENAADLVQLTSHQSPKAGEIVPRPPPSHGSPMGDARRASPAHGPEVFLPEPDLCTPYLHGAPAGLRRQAHSSIPMACRVGGGGSGAPQTRRSRVAALTGSRIGEYTSTPRPGRLSSNPQLWSTVGYGTLFRHNFGPIQQGGRVSG
jgi:hypothetical protein